MNKFDELGDIVEDVPQGEVEEFYNLSKIKELKCQYNLIFGKRSNGKTYSVLKEIIENYAKTGQQGAYLRRYREDFIGKRGQQMFSALVSDGLIKEYTGGKWTTVKYQSSQWFFAREDEKTGRLITDGEPFCFGFSLAQMEHDK